MVITINIKQIMLAGSRGSLGFRYAGHRNAISRLVHVHEGRIQALEMNEIFISSHHLL